MLANVEKLNMMEGGLDRSETVGEGGERAETSFLFLLLVTGISN